MMQGNVCVCSRILDPMPYILAYQFRMRIAFRRYLTGIFCYNLNASINMVYIVMPLTFEIDF